MFLIRNVMAKDLDDLYELSGVVRFINLPHDKTIIEKKIKTSLKAFKSPSKNLAENSYMFVLEDLEKKKVIGVSIIHAQHGTEKEPHFYLKVANEHKYSQTINTGFVHGTLKLGLETNGPTEIGGLVIDPRYRGDGNKLGKQISFVRFLYINKHRDQFKKIIHSELMPPLDSEGNAPLWEAIGRRFMNMNYDEADKLSRSNKEFILSLFPSENIYMTLLPYEARNAIGKVGKDTEPVKAMLEKIGFKYNQEVDPFDGGPHYRANIDDIKPIKESFYRRIKPMNKAQKETKDYLISIPSENYSFAAIKISGYLYDDFLYLPQEFIDMFNMNEEISVVGFPF